MWFSKKKTDDEYIEKWKKDMLLRWTDLESRVTALEMCDKEYKKRVRTKIVPQSDEPQNIKEQIILAE